MISTILPFTNMNNFLNTIAMAQKNDYDDYGDYNSVLNYKIDKIYSDYQDKEYKYECRTGPLEGFFVSSVEFCKIAPIIDGKDDQTDSTEISTTKLYTVIGNTTSIQ